MIRCSTTPSRPVRWCRGPCPTSRTWWPGNTVTKGVTVRVQLSKGPAPRLPDVTGHDARPGHRGAGRPTVAGHPGHAGVRRDRCPVGSVVSWSVPGHPELIAGAVVDPGTTVQVVLSSGPAPRTVPTLTQMSPADAKTVGRGSAARLRPGTPTSSATPCPPAWWSARIRQPATEVPTGATVTVVVSKGPDVVAIPDVANLARAAGPGHTVVGRAVGRHGHRQRRAGWSRRPPVNGTAVTPGQTLRRGTAVDPTLTGAGRSDCRAEPTEFGRRAGR